MVNSDPRYVETKRLLNEIDGSLPVKLYKVTRAGATTGLSANAIDAKQRFVLLAPTKEIAHKTIKDSIKYSNNANANIKLLLSNHACLKNKKMVEEYPDVGKIPILPLPNKCEACKYFNRCPVTDFIRSSVSDIDGVGLTYQKLKAIMFSDSKTAKIVKKRLCSAKVFIFDEAHNYETPDVVSIQMYPHHDLSKYQELFKENKKISPFLERFAKLKYDLQQNIMELVQAKDDSLKNRMAIDLEDTPAIDFKLVIKALNETIEVMKNRTEFGLSIDDVLLIFNIVMILSTDRLVLHYAKIEQNDVVYLSAKDGLYQSTRRLLGMLDPGRQKKIIFTSATFGDHDYTPIFGFHEKMVMPDMMKSNEKMTIYPDTFRMDSINYSRQYHERIVDAVENYEKKYPGVRFICMKKNVAFWLYHRLLERDCKINVDWYRSDRTLGVASDERRCVCVGAPTAPINIFDGVVDTFEQSQKRRIDGNHSAFWQAISRFKDPAGIDESYIFCIGIKEIELKKMITWGMDRKLYMKGVSCRRVSVSPNFAMPRLFSQNEQKVINILKRNKIISRSDLYHKMRIKSSELNKIVASLVESNVVTIEVTKGVKKPIQSMRLRI